MQHLDFWAYTDQGHVRDHNEDAYVWLDPTQTSDQGYLWLVCDGMGGEAGGALASRTVIERVARVYPASLRASESPHRALEEALNAANKRLRYLQKEQPQYSGMGSTAVAIALFEDRFWLASVGDSRAYGWADDGLVQITTDHTKLEKMHEYGILKTQEIYPEHPAHHVLVNVLGRKGMDVDTLNDRHFDSTRKAALICSDGFSNHIKEQELTAAFRSLNARDAGRLLMSAVLPRSDDNITLQIIRTFEPEDPRTLEEVATSLNIALIEEDAGPLAHSSTTSLDTLDETKQATESAPKKPTSQPSPEPAHPKPSPKGTILLSPDAADDLRKNVEKSETPRADPPEPARQKSSQKGTILLSPDAADDLRKNVKKPETPRTADVKSPSKHTPQKETVLLSPDAPSSSNSKADSSTAHTAKGHGKEPPSSWRSDPSQGGDSERSSSASEPKRHLTVPRDFDEIADFSPTKLWEHRWFRVAAGALIVLAILALILWRCNAQPDETASTTHAAEMNPTDEPAGVRSARDQKTRPLADYQPPASPRTPDLIHDADGMPAYRVAQNRWVIDAHEVTFSQLEKRIARSDEVAKAHKAAKALHLPCGTDPRWGGHATGQPACVTPQEAAAYCASVGRTLPTTSQWHQIVAQDGALIARGYDEIFQDPNEGAPPAVPESIQGISEVYDGLPEILQPNAAQKRYGDLPLLAPNGHDLTRVQSRGMERFTKDATTPIASMYGVRCIADAPPLPDPEPPAKPSTSASTQSTRTHKAPPSSADGGPKDKGVGGVAPRVNAPNEAPMDPNIPSRSRIIEQLRKEQDRSAQ